MPIENLDSHPARSRPIPVWLHTASSGILGFVVGVVVSLPGSGPVSGELSEPTDQTRPAEQVRDPLRGRRADAARLQGQADRWAETIAGRDHGPDGRGRACDR
jgi:hypothetical protein